MPTKKMDASSEAPTKAKGDSKTEGKAAKYKTVAGKSEPKPKPKPKPKAQDKDMTGTPEGALPFPVVGVGASAGGLKALGELLAHPPDNLNFALVVVLHEAPSPKSHLTDILSRKSPLPVSQAVKGERPESGRVYVCPPGKRLTLRHGRFEVKQASSHDGPVTVDALFRSLALDQEADCAALVLSGSGSDGSRGVLDVFRAGGLVLAQDEGSAEYAGMPRAARATGVAAKVLPPGEMLAELADYFERTERLIQQGEPAEREFLRIAPKLFSLVRRQTGHDFSAYKTSTMRRRVERRMMLHQKDSLQEYLQLLRQRPKEATQLFSELLIGVTSFFRDPKAWQALRDQALLPHLQTMESGQTIRAWVPGCSSGEEAYTLAILLEESREQAGSDLDFQIFGTDISAQAINRAREGRYPQAIAADLSAERLRRFFREENGEYLVRKDLRDRLIFSEQDILRDPPFSRLDLLVCRNLLIYLNPEAQHKLIPLFHYTLRRDGILFLGTSESVGRYVRLFDALDQKAKIYLRRELPTHAMPTVRFPTGEQVVSDLPERSLSLSDTADKPTGKALMPGRDLGERAKNKLLSHFVPAAVVVDSQGEIIYVHGHTGKFLEPAQGLSSLNVLKMAREGLLPQLSTLLRRCAEDGGLQKTEGLEVRTNGDAQKIDLSVSLLERGSDGAKFLVVFQEVAEPPSPREGDEDDFLNHDQQRIDQLQRELQDAHESHQSVVEELESSNEELKSTNEELQSTNEELQSTNEELESSKEELQSMNEELTTVNQELRSKVDELSRVHDDMTNLVNSTQIATLFLDKELNIRRFTPEAAKLINFIGSDVGRPLQDLSSKLQYPGLTQDAREVLETLESCQRQVRSETGEWFRVRIMPYRTVTNRIDGVVLTFTDISLLFKAGRQAEKARDFAESIVETVREPLLVLNGDLEVISANRAFYRFFHTSKEETEGRLLYQLGQGRWDLPSLREMLEKVIPEKKGFDDFPVEQDFPDVGPKRLLLNARRMELPGLAGQRILMAIQEVEGQE